VIPTAQELAAYTLERQHPLTRNWVDDETRLKLLTELHAGLDVLLAEDRSIAESRIERLAPGTPVDAMLNHWVAIGDDLHAMLSMRFEGLDVTKPFVDASPLSRPLEPCDLPGLAAAAMDIYRVHNPRHVRLWSSEPIDAFLGSQRDRRFLGAPLSDLQPHDVPAGLALVPTAVVDHYDEAEAAYNAVDQDHPEHPRQASLASRESLQDSADDGLLFDITMNGTWAGYSAVQTDSDDTLGLPSYVVRDVFLAKPFRGEGLGRHLAPLLAQSLPEQSNILLGAIHANNTGARNAALAAGRQDVGGWLLVPTAE
jgi:hypothetical protein